MNIKYLIAMITFMPCVASAAIPYRVQQVRTPHDTRESDTAAFADAHRFYVGGMYDFSMWLSDNDGTTHAGGKNTSSFDAVVGVRALDTFRLELDYTHIRAKWNTFSLTGNAAFINAIVDARIDSLYRIFYRQHIVPYVGVGAGLSWNDADGTEISHDMSPAFAALGGVAVELGEYFAIDFGYRYLYMVSPRFDVVSDMNPRAHQFRVGARVNF
ncbi:MAG: porin family protein [Alphaproteobacteria bacterium]|nr:porin family protein [Alphaproteobacteria bacterium]